ncbi:MAG: aminotransferase class V-fold PLP-dependent enzyme [Phycisphaeraceae bacterium]|nr:aminotransferase class V-fold PLP-dependent enzyme [Phycisphaeraceae bacterium]
MKTTTSTRPSRSEFATHWRLDPAITFLNHGSYGACPEVVIDAQNEIRALMEREPVRFFMQHLERLTDVVRERVGAFVNCAPKDLAFAPNATVAIATVLQNIDFKPGDEILVNTHEYMSAINELGRMGERLGTKTVKAKVPFPITDEQQVIDAVMAAVTPRTKLAIISHITSPTAIILPVKKLTDLLHARGIRVLIDGAHAPAQVTLDVTDLGADYYVADFHKWVSSPKGSSFLHVQPGLQKGFRPISLSSRVHNVRDDRAPFLAEFDYVGTSDYSALLAVPAALDFFDKVLPGGIPALMKRNHDLVVKGRAAVCKATGLAPPAPEDMLPSMATILLPALPAAARNTRTVFGDPLQDRLVDEYRIQVPVWALPDCGTRFTRISAQLYNTLAEFEYLGKALALELERETRTDSE